jgi:hypothetical protein
MHLVFHELGSGELYAKRPVRVIERKRFNDEVWCPTVKQFLWQVRKELILGLVPSAIYHPCYPLNFHSELCIPGLLGPESIDPKSPTLAVIAGTKPTAGRELQLKPEVSVIEYFVSLTHVLTER